MTETHATLPQWTDLPPRKRLGPPRILLVDDEEDFLELTSQRLRDAGFEVEDTRQLWGADRAFAIAPGGHRVEIMAAPPPPTT